MPLGADYLDQLADLHHQAVSIQIRCNRSPSAYLVPASWGWEDTMRFYGVPVISGNVSEPMVAYSASQ